MNVQPISTLDVGSMRVENKVFISGQPVEEWGDEFSQSLFYYLVSTKGLVTREQIIEEWCPEKAANFKLANKLFLKSRRDVKIALDLAQEPLLHKVGLTVGHGPLQLNPRINVVTDDYRFECAVKRAKEVQTYEHWNLATELFGNYLEGFNTPWIVERRRELDQLQVYSLVQLAKALALKVDFSQKRRDSGLALIIAQVTELACPEKLPALRKELKATKVRPAKLPH